MSIKHYKPTDSEEYMTPKMVAYFESNLRGEKSTLEVTIKQQTEIMTQKTIYADIIDAAAVQSERDLGTANREQAMRQVAQCNKAIRAIDNNEYGYCESCDDDIGVGRLRINPAFTLCFDCSDMKERQNNR
jgi:DnaK suppressor protein